MKRALTLTAVLAMAVMLALAVPVRPAYSSSGSTPGPLPARAVSVAETSGPAAGPSASAPEPSTFVPDSIAPAEDITGHWEGAIDTPGTKLEIDLDFARQTDGTWKGDISIPLQNAKDLPLDKIKIDGANVTFVIAGVPGEPTFSGRFNEAGDAIDGDFSQNGQLVRFAVYRSDPFAKVTKALQGFDDVVAEGLERIKVPGAAVAIVMDDRVVYARGFGLRDVESKLPMTPDTLMAIGSSSKAFTTFALGTLVDEGKVDWDTPLRTYIPWFRLYDAEAGDRLTPRDLVTHRSGLPRHDMVWYNNYTSTREELVRRLAYLPPTADLRVRFQYNNLMFLTAGYLVETLTGKKWEEAIRTLVFRPLEMTRSNFSVADSRKDSDFAQPYAEREGKIEKIPFRDISNIGPAGAINSSVNEMSHWIMVHINSGKYKGRTIVDAATLEDMHSPYMPTGNKPTRADISPADYGLGWFIDTYRGHQRVEHGGNIDGFSALVSLFPEDRLGLVVLTNKNGTPFPELVAQTAADRIFGLEAVDWMGEAAKRQAEGAKTAEEAAAKKTNRRRPGTRPAHALGEYAGEYWHPGYGGLEVGFDGKRLVFTYNAIRTPLEHWHYETFSGLKADDPTFEDMKLTFRTDVNGRVAAVAAPFEPTLDEVVFARKPDARLSEPAYLEKVAGAYDLSGERLTVAVKGDGLTVTIPGQPAYDLVPEIGGEYSLAQVKTITLRFVEDAEGTVTAMEIYQPSGVYEAKRVAK